jgi:hypothetical protein
MHINAPRSNTSNDNLSLPYDLEIIWGLHAIMSFLDCVHTVIKLA